MSTHAGSRVGLAVTLASVFSGTKARAASSPTTGKYGAFAANVLLGRETATSAGRSCIILIRRGRVDARSSRRGGGRVIFENKLVSKMDADG